MKKVFLFITIFLLISLCTFFLLVHQNGATQIGLRIEKNHFVNSSGTIVVLRGAARWSLEFSCGDGHFTSSDFQAMKSWGMNIVRLPLNENYFLNPTLCSDNYQHTVFQAIDNAKSQGLYVLLDLHWIFPVEIKNAINDRGGQFPMPDNQALEFWRILAEKYKNDPQILFEFMNEPHDVPCSVWRDGGRVISQGNSGWIQQTSGTYTTPGFQKFVDLIEQEGAQNIIIQGASGEADLQCAIKTPLSSIYNNIAYQAHFYGTNPLDAWSTQYKDLFESTPVIAGEFNEKQAKHVLPLFENQLRTGYLVWAWHEGMIKDYSGIPGSNEWREVHDFMLNAKNESFIDKTIQFLKDFFSKLAA